MSAPSTASRSTPRPIIGGRPAAPRISRRGDGAAQTTAGVSPQANQRISSVSREPGQALPDSERSFFESRFQRDFGNVRIHTNAAAAEAAESVNARAFTLGQNIAFAGGEYRPGTTSGRRLLAHELAHTVQQRSVSKHSIQREEKKKTKPGKAPPHPLDAIFLKGTRVRRYADGKVMYVETVLGPRILQDTIQAPESHTGSSSQGIRRTIASHPGVGSAIDRTRVTILRAAYIGGGRFNFADGHIWKVDPRIKGDAFNIVSRADKHGQPFTLVDFRGNSENRPVKGGERPRVDLGYYKTPKGRKFGDGKLIWVERYDYLDSSFLGAFRGRAGAWKWKPAPTEKPPHSEKKPWRDILNEKLNPPNPAGHFHELINVDADGKFDDSDRPYRFP
ncbi:MAG: DUF4157 domain-containing protein [bacterium]|nr:DUF4157 domain-containing protein [bacterium]